MGRPALTEPTRFPTITIPESEITDWYSLGWHYFGPCPSGKGLCVMQWKLNRAPTAPFKAGASISYSVSAASQGKDANVGATGR